MGLGGNGRVGAEGEAWGPPGDSTQKYCLCKSWAGRVSPWQYVLCQTCIHPVSPLFLSSPSASLHSFAGICSVSVIFCSFQLCDFIFIVKDTFRFSPFLPPSLRQRSPALQREHRARTLWENWGGEVARKQGSVVCLLLGFPVPSSIGGEISPPMN